MRQSCYLICGFYYSLYTASSSVGGVINFVIIHAVCCGSCSSLLLLQTVTYILNMTLNINTHEGQIEKHNKRSTMMKSTQLHSALSRSDPDLSEDKDQLLS